MKLSNLQQQLPVCIYFATYDWQNLIKF